MKRNLLLLASLFMSITAFAQWEKPTTKGAEMQFSTEGVDTAMYYLYNEDACAFFTEGNAWGTQASYTNESTGLKVMFTKDIVDGEWDGKTFFINDFSNAKNGWKKLFIDNGSQMFVDLGAQANYFWECVQNGDAYRFFGAAKNPVYNCIDYEESYMGIDKSNAGNVLFPFLDMASEPDFAAANYLVDWKLVPVEEAEALLAKIAPYQAANALKELIDQYSADPAAKDIADDIAKAQAVYDNAASTVEELIAAKNALMLAYNYLSIAGATEDSPKDATGFFKNPDFTVGNINGWDLGFVSGQNVTNLGYQNHTYTNGEVTFTHFIEAWANSDFAGTGKRSLGDGRLSQTLPSLPAGKYVFSCDAIAVTQDDQQTPCKGAYLFAESGEYNWKTEIHTGNEKPEHFEFTFITLGDDVTLGLKTEKTTANWIGASNFRLVYYGEVTEDPNKIMLDEYIAKVEAQYPIPEEVVAKADVKQAFIETLEAAKTAEDDYVAKQEALAAALAAFDSSAKAYADYIAKIADLRDDLASCEYTAPEAEILSDYLMEDNEMEPNEDMPNGSADYIIHNGTLDNEQLAAELKWVNDLFALVVAKSLKEGDDCSKMLVNPKFDGNFNGWTNNGGGKLGDHNVEVFQDKVDVYQDVNDVPDGLYGITCQAFYRPGGNGSFDGSEPLKVFLYMNDFETPVMHIADDAIDDPDTLNMVNCYYMTAEGSTDYPADYYMEGKGYIPNSIWGARYAFEGGRYSQTTYGIVQDGKMRIGLTSKGESVEWVLWANFSLTYMGKNEEAVQSVIDSYYDQAANLMEETIGAGEKAALLKAMDGTDGAVGRDQKYDAMIELISAVNAAKESVAAYGDLMSKTDELTLALEEYQETADEGAIKEANDALEAALNAIDKVELDIEAVKALCQRVVKATGALKLPSGYKDATEENPCDFSMLIVNGTFDNVGDFHGWSGTAFGAGGTTSTCAEHYEKTFDTYQDVAGLPAGYYLVKAYGFYRRGNTENDYNISISDNPDSLRNTYLYAVSEGVETSTPVLPSAAGAIEESLGGATAAYGSDKVVPNSMESAVYWFDGGYYADNAVLCEVGESGVIRIGVKKATTLSADWAIFDTFQLYYLGTKEPVAVEDVTNEVSVSTHAIFNLAGQRINSLQKGINIVGGKKVFVK